MARREAVIGRLTISDRMTTSEKERGHKYKKACVSGGWGDESAGLFVTSSNLQVAEPGILICRIMLLLQQRPHL